MNFYYEPAPIKPFVLIDDNLLLKVEPHHTTESPLKIPLSSSKSSLLRGKFPTHEFRAHKQTLPQEACIVSFLGNRARAFAA